MLRFGVIVNMLALFILISCCCYTQQPADPPTFDTVKESFPQNYTKGLVLQDFFACAVFILVVV